MSSHQIDSAKAGGAGITALNSITSYTQTIPSVPLVSFTSVANLSDLLKDLPLVRPLKTQMLDLESDELDNNPALNKINLIDNKQQFEKSSQLLNSNDPYFVDVLCKTLSHIDTSKITLKSSNASNNSNKQSTNFSILLQNALRTNPSLFNGILNEQFTAFQQQNLVTNQHAQQAMINPNLIQQQQQYFHTSNYQTQHNQQHLQQTPSEPIKSQTQHPVSVSNQASNSSSASSSAQITSYQVQSDPNKLSIKISKTNINQQQVKEEAIPNKSSSTTNQISNSPNPNSEQTNQNETIKASKFYSSKKKPAQSPLTKHRNPTSISNNLTNSPSNFSNPENMIKTAESQPPTIEYEHPSKIAKIAKIEKNNDSISKVSIKTENNVSLNIGMELDKNDDSSIIENKDNNNGIVKNTNSFGNPIILKVPSLVIQKIDLNGIKSNETSTLSNMVNSNTSFNQNHKKTDKSSSAQLNTWQADLKSQLALPDDFTPELIQQLASEGYDVVSALGSGSRKARHIKQQQPVQTTQLSSKKFIASSSDSEDDYNFSENKKEKSKERKHNEEYTPSKKAFKNHQSNLSDHQSKLNSPNTNRTPNLNKAIKNELLGLDPTEHPSFKRFNQMLDDILDSHEQDLQQMNSVKKKDQNHKKSKHDTSESPSPSNDLDEIPAEYLINRQLCAQLAQEAFKLNSYSIMHKIRKENLFKLQNLLYFNIKDGIRSLHLMNEDLIGTSNEQDKLLKDILVEKLLRASDCSIISLIIMTSPQIAKELIIEDIIEQITIFIKINLTETIFPHYDPVYKTNTSSNDQSKQPSSKRKLLNQFQTSNSTNSSSKHSTSTTGKYINHFYNRMREILNLVSDLITQIDLTDTIVITLTSLSVMCFFVENINDLQLESLKIITNLFTRYQKHRQLVLDDILSSLIKLHSTKRSSRSYKCFNGDSIQMFSALILQLIQSEVSISCNEEVSFEEKETFLLTSYEQSTETAKKFLTIFFSKCKVKQADFDFRPIFENFIQDLLITVNKPEWPVSEVLLNLLGLILVSQIQNEQSDVQSRVNSLEYLGQIVSQLRKDSLEYQKNPIKIEKVVERFKVSSNQKEDSIFNLQSGLISYINSLVSNDQSLQFSKYFLVAQWLKELNQLNAEMTSNSNIEHDQDRVKTHAELELNRKKIFALLSQKDLQCPNLDPTEAFILSKYLSSLKKTLDKNFDYYLINILNLTGGGSDANTPTQVRSKAIKCLSLIIEADPQILLKQKVFSCVESNFLHQTISVREASVDLIGRFITIMPELTNHYYKLLSERILDVGVSVRKRVIKIFRDICLNQPDFEHLSEICVKILKRINDEDAIKKLVIETFYSIWFSPVNSKEILLKRVLNLVDVVSEFNVITNQASLEIFESLFGSLIITNQNNSNEASSMLNIKREDEKSNANDQNEKELLINRSKDVEKSSKKIVDCLIENVLNTEANTNSTPQAYKRLVACFSTLYLFGKIKPDYFITHAEILLPYLNIKSTNANDNQIINSAAKILECVVPLLQSPSNSFLISLEESLCKLIFQGGMMIVSSCISCLGTVVNKLTNNYKLAADCLFKFYSNTSYLKKTVNPKAPLEVQTKSILFRVLFTLGLLSKHFDVESEQFKEFKICSKQDLFETFLYFINNFHPEVQQKALIGLGSFLTRNSDYMIRDEIKNLYLKYIQGNESQVPFSLKSQIFANLTDYLNEEDQRNLAKSVELTKMHLKDDLKEMLDVQSGMASTIIQSYLKPILESYLTPNLTLRISVFSCLSMILNQGLVYPIECVPYLIAMTTDIEKKIQTKALNHLANLQKAHPNFVQSKSIAGVNVSFLLHKIIKTNKQNNDASINNQSIPIEQAVIRGYSEGSEILSMNHHLYTLLRSNRSYRRAFIQQLLKMFDDSSINRNHTTLAHMLFITDNLAYFPYQVLDEPLYLIHQIDLIISVTGINLLQTFKENLLNYKQNSNEDKRNQQTKLDHDSNGSQFTEIDFISQLDCPDEAEEKPNTKIANDSTNSSINCSNSMNQFDSSAKQLDDDEETYDSVYANLPNDLKPLKECMYKAQGCCLLLILKQFLKEVYTISDSKIQNYSPTDTAKVNDRPLTSRKTNRRFNPKQIIDYMLNYENSSMNDEYIKNALVKEYLEFKELILSIDQEEMNKIDENKPNTKTNLNDTKLTILQQKLFEGIEKTKSNSGTPGGPGSGHVSGQDSATTTPRTKVKSKNSRGFSSSNKKSANKKRKRKKDSDESSDESEFVNSDFDDES